MSRGTRALGLAGILSGVFVSARAVAEEGAPAVGELLTRIECPDGYEARVFATELRAPDGLAFDAEGRVCVAEEGAGRITRIGAAGEHETLVSGLRSPEGLCRGVLGEFLAVEDGAAGRLVAFDAGGELTVVADGLSAPEGVLVLGDRLYLTESTAQLTRFKLAMRTRVLVLHREGSGWSAPTAVLERGLPFSFSELVADGPDHLILANEVAGGLVRGGLLRLDLVSGELEVFATDLVAPEGLAWTPGARPGFPLFVAEEDLDGQGHGRVSRVDAQGRRTTFATGFGTLEDVLVGPDGRVYVSEDSTGMVIELRPAR